MPEILTESFCERCGTRYTFESVAPKRKTRKLGQFKTLGKGMKNWVLSDDSSLDEAMAEARSDEERAITTQQLDAFHSTFNFCMSCRQYTCANCWNTADGRCLSCAPDLGNEILPAPFPDATQFEPIRMEAEAWPEVDLTNPAVAAAGDLGIEGLPSNGTSNGNGVHAETNGVDHDEIPEFDAFARLAFLTGDAPTPTPPVESAPIAAVESAPDDLIGLEVEPPSTLAAAAALAFVPDAAVEPAPEPTVVAEPDPEPVEAVAEFTQPTEIGAEPIYAAEPAVDAVADATPADEPAAEVQERAAAGAAQTTELLARFRPGQNIDAELAAFEAQLAAVDGDAVTDELAAGVPEPEIAAAASLTPDIPPAVAAVAAAGLVIDAEPEPAAPAVEAEPVAAEEPAATPGWVAPAIVLAANAFDRPESVEAEQPAPEPIVAPEPEPVISAPEPVVVASVPEPIAPEPLVAVEPVAEPVVAPPAPEPETLPIAAVAALAAADAIVDEPVAEPVEAPAAPVAAEPVQPPVAAEPVQPPVAAEPVPAPVREDRIEQPTWQIFAPDQAVEPAVIPTTPAAPSQAPVRASADPQWPVRPGTEESPSMALLTNRNRASSDALWAASAREVLSTPTQGMTAPIAGVQPCSNCGLSLSANARFCRRCGTRQG